MILPLRTMAGCAAAALMLVSCTQDTPVSSPSPENKNHSTVRWIPNPAADLMSPEGTFIRAATESWAAAQSTTGAPLEALRASGFPGYEHAFNNAWAAEEVFGGRNDPITVGTEYWEIVELHRDGDMYTAGVCHYFSQAADQLPDGGGYKSGGSSDIGVGQWITFGPDPKLASGKQYSPSRNQKGPASRPADNVFGTWVITHLNPAATDLPQCKKLAPGTPADWPKPYVRADAPPTLPNDPGWPEGSRA